jgi:hypothetical protein
MALANATVWEVRPSAGSDTNGGGFVPGSSGTDWSQQNAAQYALTNGVTNGTTTIATVSATADMVGNIAYVTGGTGSVVAAWYQIISASVGVSITVDRSTGLTAGTGVTINIGGAFNTISAAFGPAIACNTVWIKNTGTYTATSTITSSLQSGGSSMNGGPFVVAGYGTTRGDTGQVTWTTSTNSVNLFTFSYSAGYGTGWVFANIKFTNTAGTPGGGLFIGNNAGRVVNLNVVNCYFSGFTSGIDAGNFGNTNDFSNIFVENTEITACTGYGFQNTAGVLVNCFIHANAGGGVYFWGSSDPVMSFVLVRCTIYDNTGIGINSVGTGQPGYQLVVINCNVVSNTSDGILFDNTASSGSGILFVANTIIVSNGGYGIHSALTLAGTNNLATFIEFTNAFYNNASGNSSNVTNILTAGNVILTGSPFNSPSTGDFSLNGTSGAGAACKGAGFQGTLAGAVGGATSAAIDIGAVQSAGGGGGTTNYIVSKNITQVFQEGP